jgi:predicted transcriptional regulator
MADKLYNLTRSAYRGTRRAFRNATGATNKCSSLFNIIKDNIPTTTNRAKTNADNRIKVVLDAIDKVDDIECRNGHDETPLVYVARKNKSAANYYYSKVHYDYFHTIIKELIKKGAEINAKDSFGRSALLHAIDNDQLDLVKTLLEKGADPNHKDNAGQTPLMYACNTGVTKSLEIVKALLSKDADVNRTAGTGTTVLDKLNSIYKEKNHNTIVKLIEEKGGIRKRVKRSAATPRVKNWGNNRGNSGEKMYQKATAARDAFSLFSGGGTRRKRRNT